MTSPTEMRGTEMTPQEMSQAAARASTVRVTGQRQVTVREALEVLAREFERQSAETVGGVLNASTWDHRGFLIKVARRA